MPEFLRVTGSLLGIILGLVLAGVCIGAWYISNKAVDIMHEIASRDVSGPRGQVEAYNNFFAGLSTEQFIVRRDEPRNLQNVITYLWTVEHRQSGEVTQFRWEWDMSTADVKPRSNGALLLDRRLKHIPDSELGDYDFYDPDDAFAMAIVTQDISLIGMEDISTWEGPIYSDGVAPPLISPDDASDRASSHAEEEKQKLEDELGGGGEPDVHLPSGPPVEVDQ